AYSLVTRQIELVIDPGQRRKLRVHAADLARDELGREAEATELLRSIFDEEPTDPEVANSLAQAYTVQERFEELGDLLEQLIGIASEPSRRAELQMKLALLRREKLDDVP